MYQAYSKKSNLKYLLADYGFKNSILILLLYLLESCYGLHFQAFCSSGEKFSINVFCRWRTESP